MWRRHPVPYPSAHAALMMRTIAYEVIYPARDCPARWPAHPALFKTLGSDLLTEATPLGIYLPVSAVLLAIVTWAIFSVVRHSDALAIKLGEPFGTLILTLSVISLEVVMISSVMLTGEPNPVMARDTMFAVVMLVTNGLVGFTLLFGGWRYHTQSFNLDGVKSYLVAIIPLALLCLVLPNFTEGATSAACRAPCPGCSSSSRCCSTASSC